MGRVRDTVNTVNSAVRTVLATALVGGAGFAGYLIYDIYNQPQQQLAEKEAALTQARAEVAARQQEIADLNVHLDESNAQVERLEVAMRLLKVRRRIARLTVLDQQDNADTGRPQTRIEFVEVNDDGQRIGEAQQFDIDGDLVYVDYLLVTFDDRYVEESDLDRSTAICLFQRIFGEHQEAADGYQLDQVGTRPSAYGRGTPISDFERQIWDDFWTIANDRTRAAELGIDAARGQAVSMRVRPGRVYEVELRSTGEMSFRPVEQGSSPPVE